MPKTTQNEAAQVECEELRKRVAKLEAELEKAFQVSADPGANGRYWIRIYRSRWSEEEERNEKLRADLGACLNKLVELRNENDTLRDSWNRALERVGELLEESNE